MDAATQFALAYALTATAGLRGFLTLFAAAVAAHYHLVRPSPDFEWLGSDGSLVVLGVFALLEIAADKIPAVDHALHAISFAVRPAAAAILVGGTVNMSNSTELIGLMAAGALNALLVHTSVAAARAASTATTLGVANPVLSFVEDGVTIAGIIVAFAFPIVAALLALVLVFSLIFAMRRIGGRLRKPTATRAIGPPNA